MAKSISWSSTSNVDHYGVLLNTFHVAGSDGRNVSKAAFAGYGYWAYLSMPHTPIATGSRNALLRYLMRWLG